MCAPADLSNDLPRMPAAALRRPAHEVRREEFSTLLTGLLIRRSDRKKEKADRSPPRSLGMEAFSYQSA